MARDEQGELRIGSAGGPYDIEALDTPAEELENSHLDLGSVLVPVVEGGQVTVEMSAAHEPEAVYLVTPHGRISVSAFAAPKSPGLWREVVTELAASLREEGAQVSIEDGHWGREIVATVPGAAHRFVGVDGPRWMVRCIASGPDETADELGRLARAVLAESVVRRGDEPHPPRDALPIVLPPVLAEQVAAAQQQMLDEQGPTDETGGPAGSPDDSVPGGALEQVASATVISEDGAPPATAEEPAATEEPAVEDDEPMPRSSGSAMQRFRRNRRG
ncbi:DUF3710 domain-containing protein [Gordonia sp. SID5947]|uniref:DUF3710 domain-containing protein n=1 Tax=Gordonia sp. SID5947 TaxID=2690315 RepID=UPI00136EE198|nr:DUF3710 domain-containing protein [Gordonia sp. SID5947]MYR05792.1 DUF3710 domain-containing protein [Gordonia sp. SID5947]